MFICFEAKLVVPIFILDGLLGRLENRPFLILNAGLYLDGMEKFGILLGIAAVVWIFYYGTKTYLNAGKIIKSRKKNKKPKKTA